jgi:hypothetical protein
MTGSGRFSGSCLCQAREPLPGVAFCQDVAGDDDLLDLAGAVVDLGHLRVAEVAFDVVALQVAATAEDLDGVRRVLQDGCRVGGESL